MQNELGPLNRYAAIVAGLSWLTYILVLCGFFMLPIWLLFLLVAVPHRRMVKQLSWNNCFGDPAAILREARFRTRLLMRIPIDLVTSPATLNGTMTTKWREKVFGWPSQQSDTYGKRFWIKVGMEPFYVSESVYGMVSPGNQVSISYYPCSKIVTSVEKTS